MRDAERKAAYGTPEEFAEACLPASNWIGDEWKSRRASIVRMVRLRDEAMKQVGFEEGVGGDARVLP